MKDESELGFSYIDVMIAIVVLMVGILALLSAITGAVFQTKGQEQQLNAKQIATSTMESIMTVKETDLAVAGTNTNVFGWNSVGNVCTGTPCGPVPGGVFLNGFQPVRTDAGRDEVFGTVDDAGTIIPGFQRQIVISDECDQDRPSYNCNPAGTVPVSIRSVQITVTYFVGSIQRQERLRTILTNYAIAAAAAATPAP